MWYVVCGMWYVVTVRSHGDSETEYKTKNVGSSVPGNQVHMPAIADHPVMKSAQLIIHVNARFVFALMLLTRGVQCHTMLSRDIIILDILGFRDIEDSRDILMETAENRSRPPDLHLFQ